MFDEESGLQETEIIKYTPVITLDSLPKCRYIEYKCPEDEWARNCLKAVVEGDLKTLRRIVKDKGKGNWMKWVYQVELTLFVSDDGVPENAGIPKECESSHVVGAVKFGWVDLLNLVFLEDLRLTVDVDSDLFAISGLNETLKIATIGLIWDPHRLLWIIRLLLKLLFEVIADNQPGARIRVRS